MCNLLYFAAGKCNDVLTLCGTIKLIMLGVMEDSRVQMTIRLPVDVKRQLEELSDRYGYTQNWFIERAIRKAVDDALAKRDDGD